MEDSRPRWSPSTKLTVVLLLLGLGIYLLSRFKAAISPLVLAAILAYVVSPLVNWFDNRLHIRRSLATLLAYLVLLAAVITIPMVLIPPLADQATALNLNLQQLPTQIEAFLGKAYTLAGYTLNLDALLQQTIGSVRALVEPVFGRTLELAIEAISSLVWVIFIMVVSFYLVKDIGALHSWIENHSPPAYREDLVRLRYEISQIWSAFFRGQLVLATVVALIITTAGLIVGLPFALVMGVFAGLMEFLPSVGHGIWLFIASLLAFFIGSTWLPIPNWVLMLLVIGLHLVFEQFDLNYLIPRIIGRRVHLPPLVVILGIVTGALLAGFLGIFLAAPTIASARVIGRYLYASLLDRDPFPDTVALTLPPPNLRWWRKPLPTQPEDKIEKA